MKKIHYIILLLAAVSIFSFVSCEDMLEASSDKNATIDDNYMQSDSLYSMFGILYQLQKIADSYVILGELRGELLEVSEEFASKYLKEIYNFDTYSTDNPYTSNKGAYYEVINSCNYVINNIDTSMVSKGDKPMYRVAAAAVGIKAWTYMQLMLNFGEAYYLDKPILSIQDGLAERTPMTMETLFPKLIQELLPYETTERLNIPSFGGYRSSTLFFPTRVILGDLYLWTGQYENAANAYRDAAYFGRYTVSGQGVRDVVGTGANMEFTGNYRIPLRLSGKDYNGYVTVIAASNEFEHLTDLNKLFFNMPRTSSDYEKDAGALKPSKLAVTKFDSAFYFHDYKDNKGLTSLTTKGDLRKSSSYFDYSNTINLPSGMLGAPQDLTDYTFVRKYYDLNSDVNSETREYETSANTIIPYRVPIIYLRYAEAINRLGKPNVAMAVLKNGLKRQTLINPLVVPEYEIPDPIPNYLDFYDTRFDTNIGVHACGSGNTDRDTTFYKINLPEHITEPTLNDSILFVENLIQEELVYEMAYEGQRYQDLMRFAIRRNDNAYLANIVSEKFEDAALRDRVRNKLLARENWYIK